MSLLYSPFIPFPPPFPLQLSSSSTSTFPCFQFVAANRPIIMDKVAPIKLAKVGCDRFAAGSVCIIAQVDV